MAIINSQENQFDILCKYTTTHILSDKPSYRVQEIDTKKEVGTLGKSPVPVRTVGEIQEDERIAFQAEGTNNGRSADKQQPSVYQHWD